MIDLKKASLPKAVEVDGRFYRVHTSFKYWLRFLELIEDKNTPPSDFDFMYIDDKPQSRLNGVLALIQFCNPPQVLPRITGGSGERATDYAIDADYIYALQQGRVEEDGDPDSIYKKGGIYKDIIDASARSLNIEKIARTIDDGKE